MNERLDKKMHFHPTEMDRFGVKPVTAVLFSVADGKLITTKIRREQVSLYFPSDKIIGDPVIKDMISDPECPFLTESEMNDCIEEYGRDEYGDIEFDDNDFIEIASATRYIVGQESVSIDELKERAYRMRISVPFCDANFYDRLFWSRSMPGNTCGGYYVQSEPSKEELMTQKISEEYAEHILNALKQNNDAIYDIANRLDKQNIDDKCFFIRKDKGTDQVFTEEDNKIYPYIACRAVLELPGLKSVKSVLDTPVVWGVKYDVDTQTLYGTADGKVRLDDTTDKVSPEHLVLMLTGFAIAPSGKALGYLMNPKNTQLRDAVMAELYSGKVPGLEPPQKIFDRLVGEKAAELMDAGKIQLIDDGDKPHGLYLNGHTFIPLAELENNNSVLHLCQPHGRVNDDGSASYGCKCELVKVDNHYELRRGRDGFVDEEEDCRKAFPDYYDVLTIKDDKITECLRYEGHGPNGESWSPYKAIQVPVKSGQDEPNQEFVRDHRYNNVGASDYVTESVFAGAVFKCRDVMLAQRIS